MYFFIDTFDLVEASASRVTISIINNNNRYIWIFQTKAEHCILMALPYGRSQFEFMQQQLSLETGFIKYLGEDKKAAGIVNVPVPGSQQVRKCFKEII